MNGKPWTDAQLWRLIALHADISNKVLARHLGHSYASVCRTAANLGLKKSPKYLAGIPRRTGMLDAGARYRFPKGHAPANAGLRRPGWFSGRMRETQFKKGQFPFNRDPEFYVLGALRVNVDGYIDMRVSFDPGAKGWRGLHRILWEDAHGPVPTGHIVAFKDGDRLNVELRNLKLISLADNMLRNTIHRLPPALKQTIHILSQLKRRIDEKQDSRPA